MEPGKLPQSEVFVKKEVFQHPQPADAGTPLDDKEEDQQRSRQSTGKQAEKTSAAEGLNEAQSEGEAGAFEGFEDHSTPMEGDN